MTSQTDSAPRLTRVFLGSVCLLALGACGDTLLERGTTGAAIGAGTAVAVDGDVATGAVLGAGAGVAAEVLDD